MKTMNGTIDCLFAHTPMSECGATPYYLLMQVWPLMIVAFCLLLVALAIGRIAFTKPIVWDTEPKKENPDERPRRRPF